MTESTVNTKNNDRSIGKIPKIMTESMAKYGRQNAQKIYTSLVYVPIIKFPRYTTTTSQRVATEQKVRKF